MDHGSMGQWVMDQRASGSVGQWVSGSWINGSVDQWVSWSWVMDHGSMGHVSWVSGSVGRWVSWSWVMDHGSMGHVSWVSGSVGRWVSGSWVTVLLTQYYTTDTITLCNAMLIIIDTYWSYRLTVVQRDGFLDLCYIDFKTACLLSALSNQSPLCRNTCRFD